MNDSKISHSLRKLEFGHVPLVIQHFIITAHGTDKWDEIVRRAGIHSHFEDTQSYDDGSVRALIQAATTALHITEDILMTQLGEAYLRKLQASGHSQLLKLLGSTFYEFVQNLDFVHTVALAKYPKANIPLFNIDKDSSPSQMLIHYYSHRDFFTGMVESLLRLIAREYYQKELRIQIISETTEHTFHGHPRHHVLFGIDMTDGRIFAPEERPTMVADTRKHSDKQLQEEEVDKQAMEMQELYQREGPSANPILKHQLMYHRTWQMSTSLGTIFAAPNARIPHSLAVGPREFCEVFPYHFVFDEDMKLLQSGIVIQAFIQAFQQEGTSVHHHLTLIHPAYTDFTYENVLRFITCPHVFRLKENRQQAIYLRGQMIELKSSRCILYLCSPYVACLNDLESQSMHLADLPTHDLTKYLLLGDSATQAFFKRTTKSDWLEKFMGHEGIGEPFNDLDEFSVDMYCMVPSALADVLRSGRKVEGRQYRNVTVLFADIVNFVQMAETCRASEVVEILNILHQHFSNLSKVHDVFKCDAIGDAYVVVSGIPQPINNHAEKVANMALGMIIKSRTVPTPYRRRSEFEDGSRGVSIRIGIHTGSVVGGIIDKPIPRFVVMGDTVVFASRLESHGVPDNIQISEETFKALRNRPFEFKQRPSVEIRGRGRFNTYLLMGNHQLSAEALTGGAPGLPSQEVIARGRRGYASSHPGSRRQSLTRGDSRREINPNTPEPARGGRRRRRRNRVEPAGNPPTYNSHSGPPSYSSRPQSSHSEMVPRGVYEGSNSARMY